MNRSVWRAIVVSGGLSAVAAVRAQGQAPIGSVRTEGAQVQGVVAVSGGRATIQNSGTVQAGKEASEIALSRGGAVRVCAGSVVALSRASTRGSAGGGPLLFGLQRGAAEIQMKALRSDAVLTPDLRLELSGAGPLDLRLRVNQSGDTCVENLGRDAPMLHVTEQFSGAGYLVKPGQRVLFEHGSVREVVDREGAGCGCPKRGAKDDFPEAVSAGLQQPEVPAAPVGTAHVQVSAGVDYDGNARVASGPPGPDGAVPVTTSGESAGAAAAAVPASSSPKPRAGAQGSNPFRAIGRFFRRLFGGGS